MRWVFEKKLDVAVAPNLKINIGSRQKLTKFAARPINRGVFVSRNPCSEKERGGRGAKRKRGDKRLTTPKYREGTATTPPRKGRSNTKPDRVAHA